MTESPISEPRVHVGSKLPKGYKLVRKGDVYVTRNCRKLTQEAGETVYVVEDDKGKQKGIRVPCYIYDQVLQLSRATKNARAEAVAKKDFALETKVKSELLRSFPKVPSEAVTSILKHTLKKRSRRVGRSKDVPIEEMVDLAVKAHIRHVYTGYDEALRRGVPREKARKEISNTLNKKIEAWGGKTVGRRNSSQFKRRRDRAAAQNAKRAIEKGDTTSSERLERTMEPVEPKPLTRPPVRRRSLRLERLQHRRLSEELDLMDLD